MARINIPGFVGRYFIDSDSGLVYSLIKPGMKGEPYQLSANSSGAYALTREGMWYQESVSREYINRLVEDYKRKNPVFVQIPKDETKYVIAICNDLYGETYTYDQLQARVEELVSEGDCEPEDIQVLVDPGFVIKVKTTVSFVKE